MIEIDGTQHLKKEDKEYDKVRSDYFAGLDINVLRFTNTEIATATQKVVNKIKNYLVQ